MPPRLQDVELQGVQLLEKASYITIFQNNIHLINPDCRGGIFETARCLMAQVGENNCLFSK
jgi:hypothetical protein